MRRRFELKKKGTQIIGGGSKVNGCPGGVKFFGKMSKRWEYVRMDGTSSRNNNRGELFSSKSQKKDGFEVK